MPFRQDLEVDKRHAQNKKTTDRVLYTAAANYVADRVLGLRNYNDDNIVVLQDGTICQTNFDNIFGHVVAASSCEYPALISPVLGEFLDQTDNSWPIFRRYCQMLYAKLRTHHQLLLEQLRILSQLHKADHGDRLMWHAPHYVTAMLTSQNTRVLGARGPGYGDETFGKPNQNSRFPPTS